MQATVGGEVEELSGLVGSLSRFAQALDPDALVPGDAVRLLTVAARGESILATIKGLAGLRVDDTQAWRHAGFRSAADYAASKTSTTRAAAKEALDTARKARDLPSTDEAMRNGDLTARQAKEVADAATADPEAERGLLVSAGTDDFSSFKDKARRAKAAADPDPEARARRIHRERSLRHWTDPEGVFCALLRTTPEAGARFLAGLEPHRRAVFDQARRAGRREPPEAYLADALDHLATAGATSSTISRVLAGEDRARGRSSPARTDRWSSARDQRDTTRRNASGHRSDQDSTTTASTSRDGASTPPRAGEDQASTLFDQPPGDPTGDPASSHHPPPRNDPSPHREPPTNRGAPVQPAAPPGAPPPSPSRSAPPTTVHLNIDLAALQRGRLQPGDTCEIPGVGPINLTTARALLGDATVKLIIKHGNDIATVIHHGRTVTARQRSALEARDPCCIVPGCGITHHLEIDHRTGWAINHQTQLSDLARLCKHHHRLKTHEGYTYTGGPGTWTWHPPNPSTNSSTDSSSTPVPQQPTHERPPHEQTDAA